MSEPREKLSISLPESSVPFVEPFVEQYRKSYSANRSSGVVTVVPLTSNIERVFTFEVALDTAATGLVRNSKACAQQVRTI